MVLVFEGAMVFAGAIALPAGAIALVCAGLGFGLCGVAIPPEGGAIMPPEGGAMVLLFGVDMPSASAPPVKRAVLSASAAKICLFIESLVRLVVSYESEFGANGAAVTRDGSIWTPRHGDVTFPMPRANLISKTPA